jgi:sigma-B regulation protein RsbU (phosphoserine phosphatase)
VQIAVATDVLRNDMGLLVVGELTVSAGLAALVFHLFRSRTADRSSLYFGLSALLYGMRLTAGVSALQLTFPNVAWGIFNSCISLVIGLPFVLYIGATIGRAYSWFIRAVVVANVLLAAVGAVIMLRHEPLTPLWPTSRALAVASLSGWVFIGFFPRIPINHEVRVLRIGLMVLALAALYRNLAPIQVLSFGRFVEPLAMVFLLGTFLYVSASRGLRHETRLIAIRNELDIARKIQSALLPSLEQGIAGFEIQARYSPAGSVAGDFYDVLSDGHGLGVLIADVSGHGVPAALSASMLKVALRAQAEHIANPAEVLGGLNTALSGMIGDQFITAAFAYFDPVQRELRYAGAGHPPLLVWRYADKQVISLEENGLFLGPFAGAQYSAITAPFEPCDRCLLFTDGLVEASNRKDEEFGVWRLRGFLARNSEIPANVACTALLREVMAWSGGRTDSQQDDITFVVVEFENTATAAP